MAKREKKGGGAVPAASFDNWGRRPLWKDKQARRTVMDIQKAIHEQCKFCNQVDIWTDDNDCISPMCSLYPYRPGTQRPDVDGYKRAAKSGKGFGSRGK